MKFSHSIQFNAVPDWSSHYISYSNLKKLIYQLEKSAHQSRTGDSESRPLIGRDSPEDVFSSALRLELEKITTFYTSKEAELLDEAAQLLADVGDESAVEDRPYLRRLSSSETQRVSNTRSKSPHSRSSDNDDSGSDEDETTGLTRRRSSGRRKSSVPNVKLLNSDMSASTEIGRAGRRPSGTGDEYGDPAMMYSSGLFSSGIMLKKRIITLYVQLCELKSYIQLNRTGFSKVLKKFDKILDKELKNSFIQAYVDSAYPFQDSTKHTIEENISKMEKAYAEVITDGDLSLARKDLRSHLREHVVWERNTVWRDLIGIERRAEAAGLGQSLLGQEQSTAIRRLQGDEAKALVTRRIRTPFGSITLPPWLASSSLWTLVLCIGVFLALLLLPLMEKPEQQNCLAMLVFVSMLWATETLPLFVTSLIIPFLSVVLNVVRDETPGKTQKRLNSKEATTAIFAAMWTPVIMLLLGGFTLAAALSKCTIDKRLATLILSKAGTTPRTVLIANMFVAAFASMLISNVAAPVLCYSIIEPMLRTLPSDSNMSKAVIIGIALASNIGGMLSPIASPQNVVAMGIMQPAPTWLQWFFIVIPVGAVSLFLIWFLLLVTFQPGKGTTIAPIRPVKEKFTGVQWFVTIVTITTIGLWCGSHEMEGVFGDMGVIAIIPIVLFFGIGILTKEDFNNFPWTIIILAAGGLSLGKAVRSSGLLHTLAELVSQKVEGMSLYGVLVVFSTLILVIATFISHTVAALIFLPLVFDVGVAMDQPHPNLLVMGGVLMCSAAMGLPTSGFPNMSKFALYPEIRPELTHSSCDHEGGSIWPTILECGECRSLVELNNFELAGAMLSAFTARPIIELRQRDKSKIETILANGDRVLVGLNSGALRVYRLNELAPQSPNGNGNAPAPDAAPATPPTNGDDPSKPSGKPTDLLREVEKFSTRAIEQLAIIKEANTIVSLSSYHVSLHNLHTYEPIETLSRTKNASCFAVTSNIVKDPDTGIPEIISRLAVPVKRRLLLWAWNDGELSEDVGEVTLSESIRSVTWASATKLVCGMNGGYVMVNVVTQETEEIVSPGAGPATGQTSRFGSMSSAGMGYMGLGGYMPKPLVTKLADGEMLLAKDINTLFIDDNGKPLEKRQIPWQSAPDSIGYSYPYILALQPPSKGSLEVRNPDTLSLLQNISLPGAAQLHFPPPTVSLAHAGKGFHISSDRCVWKMGATDYDSQIQELVDGGKFDEAISILDMLEDALLHNKTETLREVKMLKAEALFKKKRYRQAMDLFVEDDVHAAPERVLKLFPPQIAGELSAWTGREEEPEEPPEETPGTPESPKKSNGSQRNSSDAAERPTDVKSSPNVGWSAKLLMGGGKKPQADTASTTSSRKDENEAEDGSSTKEPAPKEDGPLDGKDLMNAVLELNSYLAGSRARLQRVLDPVTGKLKPKADRSGTPEEEVEKILRTSLDESEKKLEEDLRKTFRLVDTSLFRAYMYSQPTLTSFLFRIPNFCDPDVVNEKLLEHNRYTELVDFFYGKKLHKEALDLLRRFGSAETLDETAPNLHGPARTIQYLKSLPPSAIDLILEHAEWTLKASPNEALEIFIGDTENAETLPRERVVAFLHDVDAQLEGKYLEHIINELEDMTPDLHNRLVELYVKNLKSGTKDDEWNALMERFVTFLRESRQVYSLSKAFGLIPRDDPAFYEAQAVVLSNMGQHKQALEIYVFKMKDYVKAEDYCNRVHKDSPPPSQTEDASDDPENTTPSIYHTLLSLYLQPNPPNRPNLEPALDLLSKHGSRLPATSTLGLIPDELPVSSLESYFRGRIRSANTLVNDSRIAAGLRKSEGISIAARLHLGDDAPNGQGGRNRHVAITEERACVVCHKKLGGGMRIGGSVVAVLADNTVVHYGCLNRVTGGSKVDSSRAPTWGRGF
ncbi:SPX domain-containing protein [Dactylonectria macrodidyma]|uniref:SPX domain-containing protein n=1 Tax=Dactylonectria macrodidyma TaxID=307937 RepID=A0A9P9FFP1_9HYPO|nr:SPX domain-containing protein [Dactylonectria macrodidyma]